MSVQKYKSKQQKEVFLIIKHETKFGLIFWAFRAVLLRRTSASRVLLPLFLFFCHAPNRRTTKKQKRAPLHPLTLVLANLDCQKTVCDMVVNNAGGLQKSIHDSRTYKFEPTFFQIFANLVR